MPLEPDAEGLKLLDALDNAFEAVVRTYKATRRVYDRDLKSRDEAWARYQKACEEFDNYTAKARTSSLLM
jgi:hypothetical protein